MYMTFCKNFEQEIEDQEIKELMSTLYQGDIFKSTYVELETAYDMVLICLNKKKEDCEETLKTKCIKRVM